MKLTLHRFELRTRHPFTIARGTTTISTTLVVELEQDGAKGYGEATESAYYGASAAATSEAIQRVRPRIEAFRLEDPAAFWDQLAPQFLASPFALCALDTAAWDLWGKLCGAPVWKLWGLSPALAPACDYTIGIDSIDVMVRKLAEFPDFPIYKIKLGTREDLAIVRALRERTSAVFRVDANCAWAADEAIRNSHALKELGVELIEQPLAPDRWDDMRRVAAESALPIVADESCYGLPAEPSVDRCKPCFHGINIKPPKCGGLTPARRMIDRARALGLRVMVGCFTESTVGISAFAQLGPLVDYVDLDGALLLAEDIATGVRIEGGRLIYPNENGCGTQLQGQRAILNPVTLARTSIAAPNSNRNPNS